MNSPLSFPHPSETTAGYWALFSHFELAYDDRNPADSALGWLFALAHLLFHLNSYSRKYRGYVSIPKAWGFRHDQECRSKSDSHASNVTLELLKRELITRSDMVMFGNSLHEYRKRKM